MSLARDCAPRCKNISNERPCLLDRGFPLLGKTRFFLSSFLFFPSFLPSFLASNDLSNFRKKTRKKERYSQRSSIIQTGARLVSKKCRPFSREERIYIYIYILGGYKSWIYISRKLWVRGFERRNLSVSIKLVSYRCSRC